MGRIKNLIGQRFGMWLVIERAPNDRNNKIMWKCMCDCGAMRDVLANSLLQGKSCSCGCIAKDRIVKLNLQRTKHGYKRKGKATKEYLARHNALNRCCNPKSLDYKNYGGRGIKMYQEWIDNPEAFVKYVLENLGPCPPGYSLDRIDVNGNYEPGNLQWSTNIQQQRNKRNSIVITYANKTQSLKDWAEELNLPYRILWDRLYRLRWSIERTFTEPVRKKEKNAYNAN